MRSVRADTAACGGGNGRRSPRYRDRDAPARRVHVLKQKDADPGSHILFTLKPVDIGADDNGDLVTSRVVEPSELDALTVKAGRKMSTKEKIAYQ